MGTTITNNFTAVCRNVAKDNGLEAAVLLTVKADRKKNTAQISLNGEGPNKQAVERMKEIISTALSESIKAFNEERAKEADNAS